MIVVSEASSLCPPKSAKRGRFVRVREAKRDASLTALLDKLKKGNDD
jgi:hypothetical protein